MQSQHPDVRVLAPTDGEFNAKWRFLVSEVFPSDQVEIRTARDAHGVETISVRVSETIKPLREALLVRQAGGKTFPVTPVSEPTFKSVYAHASSARLPEGSFLRLLNAELITGFLNPFFVVVLTPLVVAFFGWRVRVGKAISTARKLLYGMLITFVALLFMAGAAYSGDNGADKVTLLWLVVFYVVVTSGELFLSPMGLSLVTKLSPKRLVGLMMGGWFVSTAVGNKLSGFISQLPATSKMFVILSLAVLAVAMVILVLLPILDRAIKRYAA